MPSATKFHIFKEKTFQGLVYCDYCEKLLWGPSRQGVECTECGYSCHSTCSDMVIQCRQPKRHSSDSLSVTDSEAESLSSKYYYQNNHRHSLDTNFSSRFNSSSLIDDNHSTGSNKSRKPTPPIRIVEDSLSRSLSSTRIESENNSAALKSPTFNHSSIASDHFHHNNSNNSSRTKPNSSSNKAFRKSLKQTLQHQQSSSSVSNVNSSSSNNETSPSAIAKAFTRLVARSRAFFYFSKSIHDIYNWKSRWWSLAVCLFWICACFNVNTLMIIPPLSIYLIHSSNSHAHNNLKKKDASQTLFPRYDENTPEYRQNLDNMQSTFLFLIRFYDNVAYHLQHLTLSTTTYRVLAVASLTISLTFYILGRYLIMAIGLLVLLNKTWVGHSMEIFLLFGMELLQTMVDLYSRIFGSNGSSSEKKKQAERRKSIEVSVYENQRWWTGTEYAPQLLRSERSAWSNITGSEPLPSKEEMPSPHHYNWVDDEWTLDKTGPWTDDLLEIVDIIECDEDGWVYSDHRWENPREKPEMNGNSNNISSKTLTRRRRWYRKAEPISDAANHNVKAKKKAL